MKISVPAVALLATIGLAWPASASSLGPMFNVVDLGTGYQLQTDSSGTASSVTGAGGGPAYVFDKSPTTSIDERYTSKGVFDYSMQFGQWNYYGLHSGGYVQYTLQNGSKTQGFFSDEVIGASVGPPHVPLGFYLMGTWHNESIAPVADMNRHGEIVGTSSLALPYYTGPTYAAFSTPTGETHDLSNIANSSISDNLNNYITSSLGINLTQGLQVDDLGQIIAQGTVDGQTRDFLLTPAGLSSGPIPTPEPSSMVLLAVASVGWILRRSPRTSGLRR